MNTITMIQDMMGIPANQRPVDGLADFHGIRQRLYRAYSCGFITWEEYERKCWHHYKVSVLGWRPVETVRDLRTGREHKANKQGARASLSGLIRETASIVRDMRAVRFPELASWDTVVRVGKLRDWFTSGTDKALREADMYFRGWADGDDADCYCDDIEGLCAVCEEADFDMEDDA